MIVTRSDSESSLIPLQLRLCRSARCAFHFYFDLKSHPKFRERSDRRSDELTDRNRKDIPFIIPDMYHYRLAALFHLLAEQFVSSGLSWLNSGLYSWLRPDFLS